MSLPTAAVNTASPTSSPTISQKYGRNPWWRITISTPCTIHAATLAMPHGRAAKMIRRIRPHVTTEGPDSHRILNTGGTLLSARTRSAQAFALSRPGTDGIPPDCPAAAVAFMAGVVLPFKPGRFRGRSGEAQLAL